MTYRLVGLGFGFLFLLVQFGCNDIVTPPPTVGPGGGGGRDLCADEGGPVVSILLPRAASDPNTEAIVTDSDLTVDCEAAGSLVDDSSVQIVVRDDTGMTEIPVVVNNGDGTYSGTVDLASFANGLLYVACEASDSSSEANCSSAAVTTFLDLGPSVAILAPSDGSVQAGGMDVIFTVASASVSDSDNLAGIAGDPMLVVAGANILDLRQEDGAWIGAVDFSDPSLYQTPLNGAYEFSVTASNDRGVTSRETRSFTVDSAGPTVEITEPVLGSVIGGATDVVATVTDPSGIDPSQVSFQIGADKFDMEQVPGSASRFRGSFDANQYPTSIGEVLINVVAVDIVGNEEVASVVVELDGIAPVMEMDPAKVREGKDASDGLECSALFDPVGDRAINDGSLVFPVSFVRARVEDRGNPTASYKSGLDPESVQVWIRRGFDVALLVDTDNDGVCDSLNPDVLPGNQMGNLPAVAIDLASVAPTGSADYLATETFGSPVPPEYAACAPGDQRDPGDPVCDRVTIPRIIPDNDEPTGTLPAIFVKAPATPINCMGDPYDWQTSLNGIEGPGCMAVRAADARGNASVSPPLRVCFTKNGLGCDDFVRDEVTCTRACTGAKFRTNELVGPFN